MTLCEIQYHLYNLKNVTLSKVAGLKFVNGTKSRNASQMMNELKKRLAQNYFHKKLNLKMFDWFLNTPMLTD